MAWIVKNSGTQQIDRREEPYVSDAMKQDWTNRLLPRFPTKRAATIPCLHDIQHEHNWLPYQAMEELAEFLEVESSEVLDTATFYEEFFMEPRGRHTVWVCQSIACELCGEKNLTRDISDHLGVEPGDTTPDGRITLMKVECLGSCGTAPCALIDEKLHEDITVDNFRQALDQLT